VRSALPATLSPRRLSEEISRNATTSQIETLDLIVTFHRDARAYVDERSVECAE
jgi:hypothetical protein